MKGVWFWVVRAPFVHKTIPFSLSNFKRIWEVIVGRALQAKARNIAGKHGGSEARRHGSMEGGAREAVGLSSPRRRRAGDLSTRLRRVLVAHLNASDFEGRLFEIQL